MNVRFGALRDLIGSRLPRKQRPYEGIAGIYDRIMDHVEYDAWAEYIVRILHRFHPGARTILETACGTGSLALALRGKGYRLACLDLCPEMVRVAADKFRAANAPIPCAAADMAAIPVRGRFDAVVCIYDSINYLLEPARFRKAVAEAAALLDSGGLFIFDVCTVKNSELFFRDSSMTEVIGDVEYERICHYDPLERIQENRFIITRPGMPQVSEVHRQRIYSLAEVGSMIGSSPFTEIGRFDDMSFREGTERSERVHFVLRRI